MSSGLRVAVVSLQRLGDVLSGARVTNGFAQRRDVHSVDVVHWEQTTAAASLLPGVDTSHALPFGALKSRGRVHPLAAYASLDAIVAPLESRYDLVVNLSSTRFACLLSPLLCRSPQGVRGPWTGDTMQYQGSHPACAHLNDWGVDAEVNVFAHRDLYALAAGVRLGEAAELPPDAAAQTLCDHMLPAHNDAPIAVHIHGSEVAKQWRDATSDEGWPGLIRQLQREFGREILLLGGPRDTGELDALAKRTGAHVAAWSLRHTAELLRRCAGLVSVDTVAIHLAAAVACPTIVLRQGSARGHAFIPGTRTLLVDDRGGPATPTDIAALAAVHFFEQPPNAALLKDASGRVRVRKTYCDLFGLLGAKSPAWWPATATDRTVDQLNGAWRSAWRRSFDGTAPSDRTLETLRANAQLDAHRFGRARQHGGALGRSLRNSDASSARAA